MNKHTEETLAKLREIKKGNKHPLFGKNLSDETKAKISESMGSKLEVLDVETNETTIYYSNRQAAKALDCSEWTVRNYIKNQKIYKERYVFRKIPSE